jgi:hypothetical protein
MKTALLFCLPAAAAWGQTAAVTAASPGNALSQTFSLLPRSAVTFSVSSCATPVACTLDISISSSRLQPAAVQFDLTHQAAITTGSALAGAAAAAAAKTLTCAPLASPALGLRCVAAGLNANLIGNGVIARVPASGSAPGTVSLGNPAASNMWGRAIDTAIAPGGGDVPATPALESVVCGQTVLEPGEQTGCLLRLISPAPAGGVAIQLTVSDPAKIDAPASANIKEGSDSILITVIAK